MKYRPILFSASMVKAILSGRKTQTRRIIVPQFRVVLRTYPDGSILTNRIREKGDDRIKCPYGKPGDRLWVKETWRTSRSLDHCKPTGLREGAPIAYEADGRTNINNHEHGPLIDAGRIRQSIFMRQWMSRITLQVTDVRVQRLQDITDEEAEAEGVTPLIETEPLPPWQSTAPTRVQKVKSMDHITPFQSLWQSIHGPASWQENPYVWAITFKGLP